MICLNSYIIDWFKSSNILELYLIKAMMKGEANISESAVANFVLKAYEIINVAITLWCRAASTTKSSAGWTMERNLLSKMSKSSKKSSCPSTSDIATSIASSGNWTCMGFTNHARNQPKIYSAILSSIRTNRKWSNRFREQLNRVRRKIKNEDNENETPRKSDKILKEPS